MGGCPACTWVLCIYSQQVWGELEKLETLQKTEFRLLLVRGVQDCRYFSEINAKPESWTEAALRPEGPAGETEPFFQKLWVMWGALCSVPPQDGGHFLVITLLSPWPAPFPLSALSVAEGGVVGDVRSLCAVSFV